MTVHGISRNAEEHAKKFAPYAEQYGVILIAPFFSEKDFPDYQRLGRKGRGERADSALKAIIKDLAESTGIHLPEKIYMLTCLCLSDIIGASIRTCTKKWLKTPVITAYQLNGFATEPKQLMIRKIRAVSVVLRMT